MSTTSKPRNFWPASIVGFFVLAIIFLVTFVAWAMRQREDLVSTDYYEREVRYQQQLDSMNRSQSFATQAVVTFDPSRHAIIVTLPKGQRTGATGNVHLYRPSDARLDREFPLAVDESGVQTVDAKPLEGGLWKVRVKWNAGGRDYFLDQPVIVTSG